MNAVSAGLVHRLAGADIGFDFFLGQVPEVDIRHLGAGKALLPTQDGEAGHYLVIPAGEQPEHPVGIGFVPGFAQNRSVAYHHCVGGNDHIVLLPGNSQGLQPADPGHLVIGAAGVHRFINIRHPYDERNAEQSQKLLPPGRLGRQYYLHRYSFENLCHPDQAQRVEGSPDYG